MNVKAPDLSWTPMILDEQGREEITKILERALLEAMAVQEGTKQRLVASDSTGISYTVSILGYPSVGGEKKVGPPTDAKELAGSKIEPASKAKKASKKKAAPRRDEEGEARGIDRATEPPAKESGWNALARWNVVLHSASWRIQAAAGVRRSSACRPMSARTGGMSGAGGASLRR